MQKRIPRKSWPKLPKLAKTPKVTICTPTYNRRVFIPYIIQCVLRQTYPLHLIQWVIVDDGTDKVGDIIISNRALVDSGITVCYVDLHRAGRVAAGHKLTLGKKRNMMHEFATGDIIVYMDDDDYYPKMRVEHAVSVLQSSPMAWAAGSSEMHMYFKGVRSKNGTMGRMYQFGPYGPNHATAATFAFRRELLDHTRYNESASIAEERQFLCDNTVPFVQLETRKSILVFSHNHNSFDKRTLLADVSNAATIKDSRLTVDDFFDGADDLKYFYMEEVDRLLAEYDAGTITYKPDIVKQVQEIGEKREKIKVEVARNVELGALQLQLSGNGVNLDLFKKAHSNDVKLRNLMEKYQQLGGNVAANLSDIVFPMVPTTPDNAKCEYVASFLEYQIKKVEGAIRSQIMANIASARSASQISPSAAVAETE